MKTFNLPESLNSDLNLADLNRQLRSGDLQLNWAAVKEIQPGVLDKLLAGIKEIDEIGIETVPDEIALLIDVAFKRAKQSSVPAEIPAEPPKPEGAPAVWAAPLEPEPAEEPAQSIKPPPAETPPVEADNGTGKQPKRAGRAAKPVLAAPSDFDLREELQRLVLADLLGPAAGPEEELDEPIVRDRYLVGMLAPNSQQIEPEEQDELAIAEPGGVEEGTPDKAATQTPTFFPSSFGLSFCVDRATSSLKVTANWGRYTRQYSEFLTTPTGNPKMIWKRQPVGGAHEIELRKGQVKPWQPAPDEQPGVYVKGLVRQTGTEYVVTLFLVNGQEEPRKNRDSAWLFQPELIVESPTSTPVFQRRATGQLERLSDVEQFATEDKAMEMLYRKKVNFAAGHGVSVQVDTLPEDSTKAWRLSTCVTPTYEVPKTEPPSAMEIPALAGLLLDMHELAQTPPARLAGKLVPLADAYEEWISQQRTRLAEPDLASYLANARQALDKCAETLGRIRE